MIENLLPLHVSNMGLAGAIAFVAGLLIGLIHFATLRRNLCFLTDGGLAKALLLQLARLALLGGVLALLAMLGAFALLCGMLGILLARSIVLRRVRNLQ